METDIVKEKIDSSETLTLDIKRTPKDYKNDNPIRWCPGCGDYGIINAMHKAMSMLNLEPSKTAVISGIGCSSRLPYYMATYGMHTIHGRALAIATGLKVFKPEMSVWVATGDGDSLAIGGNHFIHAVRRNIDLNIILFNNKIYGLTKGQYSPTSDRGFVSKSSPFGTVEDPFIPAELFFGARGTFFARTYDTDVKGSADMMAAAGKHKGISLVEVLQNCVIFNDGIHTSYLSSEFRSEKTIQLKDGERMIYGKDRNKGIVLDGWNLKSVTIGEDGYKEEDILIHDSKKGDEALHMKIAKMGYTDQSLPIAFGVIRDVPQISYDEAYQQQMDEQIEKGKGMKLRDLIIKQQNVWEVK